MKLTCDQIAMSRTAVLLGVRVEGPGGWIRFAVLRLPLEMFSRDLVAELSMQVFRPVVAAEETEPLF